MTSLLDSCCGLRSQQQENRTKSIPPSDALSREAFLKVMLTGAASALPAGADFARSLPPPVSHRSKPLVRELTQDIRVYGSTAVQISGKAKLDGLKISVDCGDSSSMKWNVTVPDEGEFDLFLSYAVPVAGFNLEIRSGPSSAKVELKVTEGVFKQTEGGSFLNFERIRRTAR